MACSIAPFFLDTGDGRRFCLLNRPPCPPIGGLLYVPPFAEELNRSRRMAALAARAFAERGWLVLQMDLFGCGDSEGDFADASWTRWVEDIAQAWAWLEAQCSGRLAVWSLRAGSLLVADWLRRTGVAVPVLAWQPVLDGSQHLTQFLRLKAVAEMLDDADARSVVAQLRSTLRTERAVEIAGYGLAAGLAEGMEAARFDVAAGFDAKLIALEVRAGVSPETSPGLARWRDRLAAAGVAVSASAVSGPAFWQTAETTLAPALLERSLPALEELAA